MRRIATTVLVALATLPGGGLHAQSVISVGGELMGIDGDATTLLGVRAASADPGRPGLDFGLQLIPELFELGGLAAVADLGVGFNIPAGERVLLVPRVGGTMIMLVGAGGADAVSGVGGGVALVVARPGGTGVRFDLTYRRFGSDESAFGVSAGIAWRRAGDAGTGESGPGG